MSIIINEEEELSYKLSKMKDFLHELNSLFQEQGFYFFNNVNYEKDIEDVIIKLKYIETELMEEVKSSNDDLKIYLNEKLNLINWVVFEDFENQIKIIREKEASEGKSETKNKINLDYIVNLSNELINRISEIYIFVKIYKIKNNIVIIGPNGSGKSNFARNLKGIISNNVSIISAQRLLFYNTPENISITDNYSEKIKEFQSKTKLSKDDNYLGLILNDFTDLLLALFEEKRKAVYEFYSDETHKKESILDKTIKLWEIVCPNKKIIHEMDFDLKVVNEDSYYGINLLSDGEKVIFYYIAHTLLSEKNSYIILDEPENHLHLSSCINLWDLMEKERSDCKFIYITHNLDFASSREDKTIIWNEIFTPPFGWKFEIIENDEVLPDKYLIEMLGSKKKILFCEGDDRSSMDWLLYQKIFKSHYVIPVGGHDQVINYVRASRKNKLMQQFEVKGIIDGDFWSEEAIKKYEKDNIYVLPYNEIENFVCSEEILKYMIEYFHSKDGSFDKFKEEFYKELKTKENYYLDYTRNILNNEMKTNMLTSKDSLDKLVVEINEYFKPDKVKKIYNDQKQKINELIINDNFKELMRINNLKNGLKGICNRIIVNNYSERFKGVLKDNEKDILGFLILNLGDVYKKIENTVE